MRTTLTIEDDVANEVARLRSERNMGLKETINEILRAGIAALSQREQNREQRVRTRTQTASLGTPRLKSLDNIDEVLSFGEGEDYS